jgi:hypothetical protein
VTQEKDAAAVTQAMLTEEVDLRVLVVPENKVITHVALYDSSGLAIQAMNINLVAGDQLVISVRRNRK